MVGTEFTRDDQPDTARAKAVQKTCLSNGLMLLTCGTYDNILRWIPPLTIHQDQIRDALNIFSCALES